MYNIVRIVICIINQNEETHFTIQHTNKSKNIKRNDTR